MACCVHQTMLNVRPAYTVFLLSGLALLGCCEGWKYFYSEDTMDYDHARKWCTENYTDMVAIQNQEEIEYLNKVIPRMKVYYWIGLRKIDGIWTWVGTKKPLVKEAENWASREPNNQKLGEDCVEIYIKRDTDQGKWNDELCTKKKHALCYRADCNNSSCSDHGFCEEKINNYTCRCHEGFFGPICQYNLKESACSILHTPANGRMNCTHPFGNFNYNSSCEFDCNKGFIRKGAGTLRCTEFREWSDLQPVCQASECNILYAPAYGSMNCFHPFKNFSYNSSCDFDCNKGFIRKGVGTLRCTESGKWSDLLPKCQVSTCTSQTTLAHGRMNCSHPFGNFSYNSSCNFDCNEGFIRKGAKTLRCTEFGEWSGQTPACQVSECTSLTTPNHGSMKCSHPFGNFSYSSSCDFACNKGFIRKGNGTVHCTESGKWSNLQPECQAVTCSILKTLDHGTVTCSHPFGNFTNSTLCTFECKEGFHLIGNDVTECTVSGKWSLPVPTCQKYEQSFTSAQSEISPVKFMTLSVIGGTAATLVCSSVTLLLLMIYRKRKKRFNERVPSQFANEKLYEEDFDAE
ncbi:E-selectin-like isoform X1 [Polypterus senegalus]|uniref:E-selectin-like isoform X1 n=1 Tax=Polypterus senegalus TaxID=55291 RepID=UPI001963768A|nr:E-selectin-like isoform X1 [Polypterus senegalus]